MTPSGALPIRSKAIHFIRFAVVGALNTGFSYFVYAAFLFFGLGYQLANFLALVVGILFSFKTQGRLVFGNSSNRLFGRFVLSWALIYVCNTFLIGWIIGFGFSAYAAGAMALPFSVLLSYVTQRYFVFRGGRGEQSAPGDP